MNGIDFNFPLLFWQLLLLLFKGILKLMDFTAYTITTMLMSFEIMMVLLNNYIPMED